MVMQRPFQMNKNLKILPVNRHIWYQSKQNLKEKPNLQSLCTLDTAVKSFDQLSVRIKANFHQSQTIFIITNFQHCCCLNFHHHYNTIHLVR